MTNPMNNSGSRREYRDKNTICYMVFTGLRISRLINPRKNTLLSALILTQNKMNQYGAMICSPNE
ncbi:hypothetical protein GCM10009131_30220 [Morganella psychrotolerans]